ncbi:hypothetical protein Q3G72_031140 [Acer saccharum]|nr:hypothetical protein Q3G72_031140 [Acer saccharum]
MYGTIKVFEENCYKPIPPEVSFCTPNVEPHILPDDEVLCWSNLDDNMLEYNEGYESQDDDVFIREFENEKPEARIARMDVTLISPLSQQAGYYCSVCECVVKDSANYLDHINGKKRTSSFLLGCLCKSTVERNPL